jgi:hypothetical protein
MSSPIELYAGSVTPVSVYFATLNDLDSIPNSPGWYAWFHIPSSVAGGDLHLYRHARVDSTVKGIFNLSFEGQLKVVGADKTPSFTAKEKECMETLRSLYLAFAPPLYVGISKTLRSRLKAHRKNLQEFMASAAAEMETVESVGPDNEGESQYFGGRIGQAIRTLNITPDDLHVKFVLAQDASTLRDIERVLNFALTPHYGRK